MEYVPYALTAWACWKRPSLLVGCAANVGINSALKVGFHQSRPHDVSYGMPSGHAQAAAFVLAATWPWMRYAVLVLTLVVCTERWVHGYHSPSQIIAGLFIGGGLGWIYRKYI